ncbi:MAG: phospholipase D-like domain-containing protein [Patescibacteria group bacterium]|jgi:phosphatidylserine/phosphatidylglycerophosphate/cardiolipin synthase-like enzyme
MNCQSIETVLGGEFPKKVIPLIQESKQSIKIIVFDWRWYPVDPGCACQQFNNAIIAAKKRHVEVSVLTNCNDVLNILRREGIVVRKPLSRRLLHSKLLIVDDLHLVIGSHNYTQNAFTSNFEASVILRDCDDLKQFISYFNSLCR